MADVQMINTRGKKSTGQKNDGYGTDYIGRQKTQGVAANNASREDEYKDYANLNEEFGGMGSDSGKFSLSYKGITYFLRANCML